MSRNNTEPILTEDDDRFVMFPLKYDDVWSMYKKQVDCFGVPKKLIYQKI